MAERNDRDDIPLATAVPRKSTRISVVWIIPILAAVVAIGIAVQSILSQGPTITIVLKEAQGIEAGKTVIKYKDVNIGQVSKVQLADGHKRVEATAKIDKSAADLMVEDAKFWVVEPRVTLSGVSGLNTLLSGNYIGFEAGKSDKAQRRFTALEVPPVITGGQPGKEFSLRADDLGSLGIGSPVYYRRFQAGQVIAFDLAADGKAVDLKIFVNAPYDKYVNPGTRFWNASGVDVSVGAGGVNVRTESLVALIAGGIAFDTPSFAPKAEPAAAKTAFTLSGDRATAMKQPDVIAQRYVLYFNESLRGLSVGAPVTLLGLTGGEVTAVGLALDKENIRGRVEIVAYPERLVAHLAKAQAATGQAIVQSEQERRKFFQYMIEQRGMRAQLRSGSLLTGQLYVALDIFPDASKAKVDWSQDPPVMPVVPSTLPDLEAKISAIVAKLDKLPLEEIGNDAKKALASLDQTLQSADVLVKNLDGKLLPGLDTALVELRGAIVTAAVVLKSADEALKNTDANLLGKNAPAQQELRDALQEITRAARSLRVLSDYLERHPESLLRGKTEEKP
jgi:paraquat-inducible protein B